jgi:hypothetical protein
VDEIKNPPFRGWVFLFCGNPLTGDEKSREAQMKIRKQRWEKMKKSVVAAKDEIVRAIPPFVPLIFCVVPIQKSERKALFMRDFADK